MKRQVTFDTGNKMYHLEIEKAYPFVVSGGSPGRIKRIANYLDDIEGCIECERGLVTIHGKYRGLPITAFSTGMGPASVSIVLPEIIEACDDAKMTILRLGTAGGLQQFLNIGDFVVTTKVDRRESTSDKIMGKGYLAHADEEISKVLEDKARQLKKEYQQVYTGTTRTTDDIYFDALNAKIEYHGEVLAVSMEFSVYCALRDRYNRDYNKQIKVGEILAISDNVVKAGHEAIDLTEFQRRKSQIEESHIRIGLETLLKISKN